MPLFGPTYYCPDPNCECDKKLKQDEKCPQCGKSSKSFGMMEGAALFASKKTAQKNAQKKSSAAPAKAQKATAKGESLRYFCANPACANVRELQKGEKCPSCGEEAQPD